MARRLAGVCEAIGLQNVKVEAKAVYSQTGLHDLYIPSAHQPGASLNPPASAADEVARVTAPVVRLDDYFARDERVTMLKVDVEGTELSVFSGAERILREHMPLLIFECEARHLTRGRIHGALGDEGRFFLREKLLPISAFDPAVHQPQEGEWFWKRKNYCNNFLFSKKP